MFQQLKNIDTAFRHIKLLALAVIAASTMICCFVSYQSFKVASNARNRIYILANGKALEAVAGDRKQNIPVEARDHIRAFHEDFFTLDPDDKAIQENVTKALYLADESAKRQYDNLRESGYYANIISGNISQQLQVDSIQVNINDYPYAFRCFATEKLIRSSSTTNRSLVTRGFLRNVSRSDNNPHGFLIERWETIENKDINTQSR